MSVVSICSCDQLPRHPCKNISFIPGAEQITKPKSSATPNAPYRASASHRDATAAILLRNDTELQLEISQVGCTECFSLPSGSQMPYSWTQIPAAEHRTQRLIRVRVARPLEEKGSETEENGWVLSEGRAAMAERQASHAQASTSAGSSKGVLQFHSWFQSLQHLLPIPCRACLYLLSPCSCSKPHSASCLELQSQCFRFKNFRSPLRPWAKLSILHGVSSS